MFTLYYEILFDCDMDFHDYNKLFQQGGQFLSPHIRDKTSTYQIQIYISFIYIWFINRKILLFLDSAQYIFTFICF